MQWRNWGVCVNRHASRESGAPTQAVDRTKSRDAPGGVLQSQESRTTVAKRFNFTRARPTGP